MPLYFENIVAEHRAVRSSAALFDVSHMGKVLLEGPEITQELSTLIPGRVPAAPGRCRYAFLLDERGRILDDMIVCRLADAVYLGIPNAGPREEVVAWFRDRLPTSHVTNLTFDLVILALQGPRAETFLQPLSTLPLGGLRPFRGALTELPQGVPVETEGWESLSTLLAVSDATERSYYVTRTGYTGEDGFEILGSNRLGEALWMTMIEDSRVPPAGLGARDTLRLEKGYLLSGQDFDGSQTPLEAGYERLIDWDHDFVGRGPLVAQQSETGYRRLQGVKLKEPGVPRPGVAVWQKDREVGRLTSATLSPTLGVGIGLGYLEPDAGLAGQALEVQVREKRLKAEATNPPFV